MASAHEMETVHVTDEQLENTVAHDDATLAVRRLFTIPGRDPFAEVEWEDARRAYPRQGHARVRAEERRVPEVLEADGDEHRRAEVLPRAHVLARAGAERQADDRPRRRHDRSAWGREGGYFANEEEAETFEAELKALLVNQLRGLQLARLVQRRLRGEAAVLGVLHPLDRGLDGLDPRLDPPRGRHLPRRLGLGRQPLEAALVEGAALQGRPRERAGRLHARRRRVGRDDQVRRQDAARGEDGRPRRRPSRTSKSSSGARRRRKTRPACSSRPATTCRSTRPTGPRSSTRTRTTRCASRTRSWRPPRPTPTGTSPPAPTAPSSRRSKARKLLRDIADAAWRCADPGVQYDTTINNWHTLPNTGRINASNPCSEYMSIDDSACNLASLNLMKFRREDGELDVEAFEHAVDVVFLAQEILVGYSSYPTPEIEREREGVPPARPRLREPRRAADGARAAVRLGRGPGLRGGDHGADDRPRLPQVGGDRRADGPVRRLPAERARR